MNKIHILLFSLFFVSNCVISNVKACDETYEQGLSRIIEKELRETQEFNTLINCALHNPNDGEWYKPRSWRTCGKYFLPLSDDKKNGKQPIEATDFSEYGRLIAIQFQEREMRRHGWWTGVEHIQKEHPGYKDRFEQVVQLAFALQDQIDRDSIRAERGRYHDIFLDMVAPQDSRKIFKKTTRCLMAEALLNNKNMPKQDRDNIILTLNERFNCDICLS